MDGLDAERVRAVMGQVLAKYDWQLGQPPESFFDAVVWELRLKQTDLTALTTEQIERVVKRCYARVLYRASGAGDTAAQARAYQELGRYLLMCAHALLHDVQGEADVVQQALANVIARHAQCADEDAFLAWCRQIVVNTVRDRYRKLVRADKSGPETRYVRREVSIEEMSGENPDAEPTLTASHVAGEAERILQDALRGPMYEALVKALWHCLEKAHKVRVIVEIFLNDKKLPELAREWSEPAGNIQAIKARALETLRDCDEMKLVFQDWGA